MPRTAGADGSNGCPMEKPVAETLLAQPA
jgi:hypothetical protein